MQIYLPHAFTKIKRLSTILKAFNEKKPHKKRKYFFNKKENVKNFGKSNKKLSTISHVNYDEIRRKYPNVVFRKYISDTGANYFQSSDEEIAKVTQSCSNLSRMNSRRISNFRQLIIREKRIL